jgi:HAE1 family hydrophobic/amphiphilic exporter-1
VAAILREEEDIDSAAVFSGASLAGNAPNRGLFFFGTRNWSERPNPDQAVEAMVQRLNRRFSSIDGARIIVVEPPAIPGYGTGGGFEFQLLNRSGGALADSAFFESAQRLIANANSSGLFDRVFTQFSPEAPQLEILVDRDRMASLGVDFQSAMQAFSLNIGSFYVNDTFESGRIRRVFVQADEAFRTTPDQLRSLYTKKVPVSQCLSQNSSASNRLRGRPSSRASISSDPFWWRVVLRPAAVQGKPSMTSVSCLKIFQSME